jgi:Capsule assembly protein Wzi
MPKAAAVRIAVLAAACLTLTTPATADTWAEVGDAGLRHDLQLLADGGILRLPMTTWPIPWADVATEIERTAAMRLAGPQAAAVSRLQDRLQRARRHGPRFGVFAEGAENPVQLRTFSDTPREEGEIGGYAAYQSDSFSARLQVAAVSDPDDGKEVRLDGSYAAGQLGNVIVSAGALDRWWGPGWDGSLILSNNARPIPSITVERASSKASESKWFSWIGPWRAVVTFGQLEGERNDAPHARFFGLRVAARPLPQLEVAASRSAQLCGEDRPCGLGTWWDMFTGNDNDQDLANQPGNQLGGFDVRWAFQSVPLALYAQAIGEDEAGFLPSKYLGLLGAETWGGTADLSWRAHLEYADTACEFTRSPPAYGCAYESSIYTDGYRYYDRSIGHSADRDAQLISIGGTIVTGDGTEWTMVAVTGQLNRGDVGGNLPPYGADYLALRGGLKRDIAGFDVRLQLGWQQVEPADQPTDSDFQAAVTIARHF